MKSAANEKMIMSNKRQIWGGRGWGDLGEGLGCARGEGSRRVGRTSRSENSRCIPTMSARCPSFMQMTPLPPRNSPGGQGGLQPQKGVKSSHPALKEPAGINLPSGSRDGSGLGGRRAWRPGWASHLGPVTWPGMPPQSHRNMTPMAAEGAWGPRNAI